MDLSQEDIEALRIVANANCSASWIAETVLESEGYESYSTEKPDRANTEPIEPTQNEPERSLMAY